MNGSAQVVESYPLRRYLLDRARGKARDYRALFYGIDLNVTALNTDTTGFVDVNMNAPFLWCGNIAEYTDQNANIVQDIDAIVSVRLGGGGGQLVTRGAIHVVNFYPQAGGPFIFPTPRPLDAGTRIHVTFNVLHTFLTGVPFTIRLIHMGLAVYGYPQ
jgi:hypothetical protein